jgi:hypothetical protein
MKNLTPVANQCEFDFSTWGLEDTPSDYKIEGRFQEQFEKLLEQFCTEYCKAHAAEIIGTIKTAFAEEPPRLYLPFEWVFAASDGHRGPAVTDPLTIYCKLPFGAWADGEGPLWSCSLEDLIDRVIEGGMNPDSDPPVIDDPDAIAIVERMAARLRELAQKLDASIKTA